MSQTITDADWLVRAETRQVMAALQAGTPGSARFVGGCVRNTLMGRPVDDIDIATQLVPEASKAALEAAGIRVIPTGIEHGTVTAVINHLPFEITSLRRDVETDGRRAVVAFTEDWNEDAQRRDFRLNAIYADAEGTLFDPTGGGVEDAAEGRVIFIGDADQRLREDYLRILRFFRFNAWYGAEIDTDGLAACERQKDGLRQIAAERIWKELKKLLGAPEPYAAIDAMAVSGVLQAILPQFSNTDRLHDLRVNEALNKAAPDSLLRLMALLPREGEAVASVAKALRLSNAETDRLEDWASPDLPAPKGIKPAGLRRSLYHHGAGALIDHAMLTDGDVRDFVAACRSWRQPEFPLKGEDLVKAGLKPGPQVGALMRGLEDWWIAGDFLAGKTELLAELEARLKAD